METSRLEVLKPIILEAGQFCREHFKYYVDYGLLVTWLIRKAFSLFIYAFTVGANLIHNQDPIHNLLGTGISIRLELNFDKDGTSSVMTHALLLSEEEQVVMIDSIHW
jgi:hypothetical protein